MYLKPTNLQDDPSNSVRVIGLQKSKNRKNSKNEKKIFIEKSGLIEKSGWQLAIFFLQPGVEFKSGVDPTCISWISENACVSL